MIFTKDNSHFDSAPETQEHKAKVKNHINKIIGLLGARAVNHDLTKLKNPEKEIFDEYSPKLKTLKYGSDEYKECLKQMKPALDHHYKENSHHPEHYENGISGMNLIDITEMFCDWLASTERTKDGDILKSIEINQKRFGYSDELKQILINTVNTYFFKIKRSL